MTLAPAAAATVATIQPERTAWAQWLDGQINPGWRPGEWNAAQWFFTGDPDNDRTLASRCAVAACRAPLDGD